jgi:hypothetical protein
MGCAISALQIDTTAQKIQPSMIEVGSMVMLQGLALADAQVPWLSHLHESDAN